MTLRLHYAPTFLRSVRLPLVALLLASCSGSDGSSPAPASDPGAGYFESSATTGGPRGPGNAAGGAASGGVPPAAPGADGDAADPGREIAEADIIQLQGTRLYAMSRSGGLSVIDVSRPDNLKILGRYRTSFTPFEMYVRDGIVYAMYSDWGEFVQEDGSDAWVWKQTSTLLALDVADPAQIKKIGQFDLPGEISDSRLVGDVLYAVSYQNGSCWGCATKPSTSIVSVNIARPSAPVKVGELAFVSEDNQYGWGKRSIAVTDQRIYVAGPEYGRSQPEHSTIQVVDISDAAGELVAGTTVRVRGQITNRWQMDEHAGTLRVISQPWTWWNSSVPPALETFTVRSSQEIEPLARLDVVLPRPETLQSVRFDGTRAYAVTFERTDPLFTFDLSDPAAPKQRGELEMPGFLYHMEPRGDRLIGLGYDQGNSAGAITVSIFDVSDLGAPAMLKRVNFGGDWGQLPEDQDRIHKAFRIDAENGLMLVPFTGWNSKEDACVRSLNGVQIIDWAGDELALRGMTHSLGQARRAFIANDALFTVADQEVAAYDIADRDAPVELSAAPLSLNVSMTLPSGDQLARLRQDWYSQDIRVEIVPRSSPDALVATTTFNLTDYLRREHGLSDCGYWYPSQEPLFVANGAVWVLINDYGEWRASDEYPKSRSLLVGFSPATGGVVGSLEVPFRPGYWGWGNTSRVVRDDVVYLMQEGYEAESTRRSLATLDLSNPATPRVASLLELPATNYSASTGLLESGDHLITSYARAVEGKDNVVRHFAIRLDVSQPLAPRLIDARNVPGYVVDYDAVTGHAVTLDHQPITTPGRSWEDCSRAQPYSWFDDASGLCRGHTSTLHRVRLTATGATVVRSVRNDSLLWATPRRGDERLFFTQGYGSFYGPIGVGGVAVDGPYLGGWSWASQKLTVVDSVTLEHGSIEAPGVWHVLASGKSLILAPSAGQPLALVDGADATKPELRTGVDTALGFTQHLAVSGDDVYLSQGDGGVQRMTLP